MAFGRRTFLTTAAAAPICSAAALAQAQGGVVLRRGNIAEPDSLDPHQCTGAWENNIVGDLFMGLTTDDPEARPIPGAAERWTISADGTVWTFTLRAGLFWSDGRPLTASDFEYGFRRLLDPRTAAKYASLQYVVKNAEAVNTGKLPVEALGVRAVDDRTFEITLDAPTPFLPGLLTHYTSYPIPRHAVEQHGAAWVKPGNMVSNGPYMLVEWNPNDQIRVVKNPRFFEADKIRIDEVVFYPIEDEKAALTRFRAREIDCNIGSRGFPIDQWPWLQENMPGEAIIHPQLSLDYLVANTRRKPYDDIRIRRALSLALDRETQTARVNRDGRLPAYTFVPPGIDNYTAPPAVEYARWPKDRRQAEARRLLAEAGYGPGNPLTFDYMHMTGRDARRDAVALSALWREVGIIARPIANETKVHYNTIQAFDFDVAFAAWVADYNDPQNFLFLVDSRSGVFNYSGYNNPAYDALMDQAKVTLDLAERAQVLAKAERMMLDDYAVIPLAFRTTKTLIAPYVKGFVANVTNIHRTRWMWIEKPG
jgi:oligopeptide transport system substrate-binding protein